MLTQIAQTYDTLRLQWLWLRINRTIHIYNCCAALIDRNCSRVTQSGGAIAPSRGLLQDGCWWIKRFGNPSVTRYIWSSFKRAFTEKQPDIVWSKNRRFCSRKKRSSGWYYSKLTYPETFYIISWVSIRIGLTERLISSASKGMDGRE